MNKKETIELTLPEIKALLICLSNSYDDPDFYAQWLTGSGKRAADRMHEKVITAYKKLFAAEGSE